MAKFDAIDRKLLQELQRDATLSHAVPAERVGASSASCWRRIKSLEAAGILMGSVRLVNAAAVGRGVNVICNLRMRSHARPTRASFEEFVHARPEVLECYSISGDWDYLLRIVAADVAGYEHFLMHVLLDHPAVGGASSHFALSLTKYTTAIPVD